MMFWVGGIIIALFFQSFAQIQLLIATDWHWSASLLKPAQFYPEFIKWDLQSLLSEQIHLLSPVLIALRDFPQTNSKANLISRIPWPHWSTYQHQTIRSYVANRQVNYDTLDRIFQQNWYNHCIPCVRTSKDEFLHWT